MTPRLRTLERLFYVFCFAIGINLALLASVARAGDVELKPNEFCRDGQVYEIIAKNPDGTPAYERLKEVVVYDPEKGTIKSAPVACEPPK